MVYTPRTWVDRQVERPKTYNLQENVDGTVTLLPAEGIIIEAGTPLIAENMNQIEQGLEDVSEAVGNGVNDYIRQPAFAGTAGTSTAYTVTLNPAPSVLLDGFGITIVPHVTNGANATLNINGLGGYPLKKQNGLNYPAGRLIAGKPYTFRKVGSDFLADSAGGNGDAVVMDVRAGKKFTNDITDELVGELPVRDSGVTTVTPGPAAQTLPPGIRDFNIIVSGVAVPAGNVLSGTTIAGTAGTMPNQAAYTAAVSSGWDGSILYIRIPRGAYLSNTGVGYPEIQVTASQARADGNIVASNIRNGTWIYGVQGSLVPDTSGVIGVDYYSYPGAGAVGTYNIVTVPSCKYFIFGDYPSSNGVSSIFTYATTGSPLLHFQIVDAGGVSLNLISISNTQMTVRIKDVYFNAAARTVKISTEDIIGATNTYSLPGGFNAAGAITLRWQSVSSGSSSPYNGCCFAGNILYA